MLPIQLQTNAINEIFSPINDLFEILREASSQVTRQIAEILTNNIGNFL